MKLLKSTRLFVIALSALLPASSTASGTITTVPADLSPGPYRLVFVTDATRNAASSDIADYNQFVSNDANAVAELAALGTTFTAIASTPAVDARDNTMTDPTPVGSTGVPIYGLDGTRVADDYDQLWAGNVPGLFAPVSVTPTEVVLPGGARSVWTGTILGGTGPDGEELGTAIPFAGDSSSTSALWIGDGSLPSENLRPLYGISDVLINQQYRLDDGSIGFSLGPGNNTGAYLNQFTVTGGQRVITEIQIDFGVLFEATDQSVTAVLWSDPDGDMHPSDAVPLASVTQLSDHAAGFNTFDIPDTYVGPDGTSFFVGAVWTDQFPGSAALLMPLDSAATPDRSYAFDGAGVSVSDPTNGTFRSFGDNYIRAIATVPEPSTLLLTGLAVLGLLAIRRCRV